MRRATHLFGLAILLWVGISCPVLGRIIYVDDDANAPGDGKTWATAYRYLQDALADARAADKPVEIRVAQGVYKPDLGAAQTPGERSSLFHLVSGVSVRGAYAGVSGADPNVTDRTLFETVLSGDLKGNDVDVNDPWSVLREATRNDNCLNVMVCDHADSTAVLDGLTVTGGYYNARNDFGASGGGALANFTSNPTVLNCTFRGNTAAQNGGAIYNISSSPVIIDCTFIDNFAGYGGAISNWRDSSPKVSGCTFARNRAQFNGGAIETQAGNPTLRNCVFTDNSAAAFGGAIGHGNGSPRLGNCLFVGNSGGWGGAISCSHSTDMWIHNCTFGGNLSRKGRDLACGSYERQWPSRIDILNCIFWSDEQAGAVDNGSRIVASSADAGYAKRVWNEDRSKITIRFSDLRGGQGAVADPDGNVIWADGNIDADPLFADADNGALRLKSQAGRWNPVTQTWVTDDVTSPCIDAGDPNSPIGHEPFPNGGRINMGAYGGTAEASKSYFGEPPCETIVAGDINGDCRVDLIDFAILASHWLETGQ